MGRRTKLTPELQQRLVQALRVGCTHRTACQCAGITYSTFYDWLRRGEAGNTRYTQFSHAIKRAEVEAMMRALAQINTAMATDWRAAAWLLERSYPHEYGRRVVEQQHSGNVQHGHAWIERLRQAHVELDARRTKPRTLAAEPTEAPRGS